MTVITESNNFLSLTVGIIWLLFVGVKSERLTGVVGVFYIAILLAGLIGTSINQSRSSDIV